jgi:hypothetical protein
MRGLKVFLFGAPFIALVFSCGIEAGDSSWDEEGTLCEFYGDQVYSRTVSDGAGALAYGNSYLFMIDQDQKVRRYTTYFNGGDCELDQDMSFAEGGILTVSGNAESIATDTYGRLFVLTRFGTVARYTEGVEDYSCNVTGQGLKVSESGAAGYTERNGNFTKIRFLDNSCTTEPLAVVTSAVEAFPFELSANNNLIYIEKGADGAPLSLVSFSLNSLSESFRDLAPIAESDPNRLCSAGHISAGSEIWVSDSDCLQMGVWSATGFHQRNLDLRSEVGVSLSGIAGLTKIASNNILVSLIGSNRQIHLMRLR